MRHCFIDAPVPQICDSATSINAVQPDQRYWRRGDESCLLLRRQSCV